MGREARDPAHQPEAAALTPTFHVLVPAYGDSPFLGETLRSVLAASDEATFITVVDDGTPDDVVAGITAEAGSDVEYLRLDTNRGVAGAFQACADHSRGTYTVILGSDDAFGPGYLAELRQLVARFGEAEMLTTAVAVINDAGRHALPVADRVKRWIAPHGPDPRLLAGQRLVASLCLGNWLYFPAVAWRTDVLRHHGFRQDMTTALDLDLVLRVVLEGGALVRSPRPAFEYRRHQNSVSSRSAVSGTRFVEERWLYQWAAAECRSSGWRFAAMAAVVRPTSRLHALRAGAQRMSDR